MRATERFAAIAIALTVIPLAGIALLGRGEAPYAVLYMLVISAVAVLFYGYDKAVAGSGATRIPEVVLVGIALAGGAAASLLAQELFRHKTKKLEFRAICVIALLLQIAVVGVAFSY